jgi:hypothetical protein
MSYKPSYNLLTLRFNIFDTIQRRIRKNDFLPIDHGVSKHWSGSDTKKVYQKNLLTQPDDWYYRNNPITYTLNSNGYRTHEFKDIDWANSIVIFGCSYVFGTGLDDKHTISSQLEEMLNIPVINMGVGGSSMMFNLHNSMLLRDGYPTPKAIVMFWPGYNRIVEYHKYQTQFYGPWNTDPNSLSDLWLANNNNAIANTMFISKTSRLIWQDRCPYYEATWDPDTKKIIGCDLIQMLEQDYARDMMHSGFKSAKYIAEIIANKLKL